MKYIHELKTMNIQSLVNLNEILDYMYVHILKISNDFCLKLLRAAIIVDSRQIFVEIDV